MLNKFFEGFDPEQGRHRPTMACRYLNRLPPPRDSPEADMEARDLANADQALEALTDELDALFAAMRRGSSGEQGAAEAPPPLLQVDDLAYMLANARLYSDTNAVEFALQFVFQATPDRRLQDLFSQGQLAMNRNEWEEAIGFFNQALELDPTFFEAMNHVSTIMYEACRLPGRGLAIRAAREEVG